MERNDQQKHYYTWQELEEDIKKIAVWARDKSPHLHAGFNTSREEFENILCFCGKTKGHSGRCGDKSFSAIYGIPRGGLIPAVLLSHRTGLPLIFSKNEICASTLVIDDIVDTGATAVALEKALGFRPIVASLFFEENALCVPDFFVQKKESWVVFPWETEASSRYDGTSIF